MRESLGRILVILTFPLWFPRMLFWMVVEFFRVRMSDWSHPALEPLKISLETSLPQLSLIRGGRMAGLERSAYRPRHLRVIQGGSDIFSGPRRNISRRA